MNKNIKHHLSEDILWAYSAGTLPEAFNLMVASHLSMCDECRAVVESFDAVGGAMLEDSVTDAVAPMDDAALAATMALIAGGPMAEPSKPKARRDGSLPAPLYDYIGGGLDDVRWRPVGMGVRQAILPTSKAASARLLYIPAGAAMPDHGHRGIEMTMVLRGAFADEHDYFGPGDVEIATEEMHHTPIADISEDCICLAVTDAPLKFNGLIPKIAQPFLRI
jgi:putative transcriptional regulator